MKNSGKAGIVIAQLTRPDQVWPRSDLNAKTLARALVRMENNANHSWPNARATRKIPNMVSAIFHTEYVLNLELAL